MNKITISALALMFSAIAFAGQGNFDSYFSDGVLRIDCFLAGNNEKTTVYLDEALKEPYWGGPKRLPQSADEYGLLRYNLYDESGVLLYSKGFCPLFKEWQTTDESKTMQRAMSMTAVMPFPKNKVEFEIQERKYDDGKFETVFTLHVDPSDYFIRSETRFKADSKKIIYNGDPENHVDLVFVSEGYTESETEKFYKDAERTANFILNHAPYDKYKNKFNVYAVAAPSAESGTDIPGQSIYKNTVLNSSFYTFDIDRYLTTSDSKTISDITANVPCDVVYILINSDKYGGGGLYNVYAAGSSDNRQSDIVAVHEFGHCFAGLADEYYTSPTAYNDFYNFKIEPWEPNITTNVNFESKWKNLIPKDTPIPTPREEKYENVTGMFEGGGYSTRGIYSPAMHCIMSSNRAESFCAACQKAIEDKIKHYTE